MALFLAQLHRSPGFDRVGAVMDPNTIIEALRGTMDPALREAAERQLNEVRDAGLAAAGGRTADGGRAHGGRPSPPAWPRARIATPRGPARGVGRGSEGECHAGTPRAGVAAPAGAPDPELGLWTAV